jgi:hypothetical protein
MTEAEKKNLPFGGRRLKKADFSNLLAAQRKQIKKVINKTWISCDLAGCSSIFKRNLSI